MINLFRGHIFRLGVLAGAALVVCVVLAALVALFWSHPPWVRVEVGSQLTPGQIGMLRWYESGTPIQVTLDQHPAGIAFDGNNLWVVADPGDDSQNGAVYQLDRHSLSVTRVYTVGQVPRGVVFDGAHLWVANSGSRSVSCIPITRTVSVTAAVPVTVSQVSETDTAIITRTVGAKPHYLAFDGDYVWVTNREDHTLTRLSARTCAGSDEETDLQIPNETESNELDKPPFNQPFGIAFDGQSIWVANRGGDWVSKIPATDPDPASFSTFTVGANPYGVAFDGEHVWVALNGEDKVAKLRASDGKLLGKYDVGHQPWGVAFDGTNIWVANNADGSVTKLRASDGTHLGTFDTGHEASLLAFDGVYIWVTNYGDHSLTRR